MAGFWQIDGAGSYDSLNLALASANPGEALTTSSAWDADDTTNCTVADNNLTITASGSAKHPGYEGSTDGYRLKNTTGHSITVNGSQTVTITGLEIGNESTGTSDECIRQGGDTVTLNLNDCLLYFGTRTSQQDIIYSNTKTGLTVNLVNCIGWNAYRAVVDFYATTAKTGTINYNSCHFYNIGSNETRAGILGEGTVTNHTITIQAFNCLFHMNSTTEPVFEIGDSTNKTLTIDRCITNAQDWAPNITETVTSSSLDAFWKTAAGADVTEVLVENLTSGSEDLRLINDAGNDAQDAHADGTGAGLTMPSTDIIGTSRDTGVNDYDIGAFEYVAVGGGGLSIPVAVYHYNHNIGSN